METNQQQMIMLTPEQLAQFQHDSRMQGIKDAMQEITQMQVAKDLLSSVSTSEEKIVLDAFEKGVIACGRRVNSMYHKRRLKQ